MGKLKIDKKIYFSSSVLFRRLEVWGDLFGGLVLFKRLLISAEVFKRLLISAEVVYDILHQNTGEGRRFKKISNNTRFNVQWI